jgi:hypothetical protein
VAGGARTGSTIGKGLGEWDADRHFKYYARREIRFLPITRHHAGDRARSLGPSHKRSGPGGHIHETVGLRRIALGNRQRLPFEALQSQFLCEKHVPLCEIALGHETPRFDAIATMIELIDVDRWLVPDNVATSGIASDHFEISMRSVLFALRGAEMRVQ